MLMILLVMAIDSDANATKEVSLDSEVNCFALALYFEARGEILSASVAVAETVHNRIKSHHYPNSACDVIKARRFSLKKRKYICSFEWYCDLPSLSVKLSIESERKAWHQALIISRAYLSESPPCFVTVKEATLFHDKSITPYWAKNKRVKKVAVIGGLHFYKEERAGIVIGRNDMPLSVSIN